MALHDDCVSSAPGKVLLTGGYLVLQEGLAGLVVSSSSRFFSRVAWSGSGFLDYSGGPQMASAIAAVACNGANEGKLYVRAVAAAGAAAETARSTNGVALVVTSQQFHTAWGYALACESPHTVIGAEGINNPPSPFVEAALLTVLAVVAGGSSCAIESGGASLRARLSARAAAGDFLVIQLGAHNDFYSQSSSLRVRGLQATASALASLPPSLPPPEDTRLAKTGLGSSAALTVSLVASLLHALWGGLPGYHMCDGPSALFSALVHVVAQVSHGRAQGKIGSGFDVAAATYGSLRFSRVPATILRAMMDAGDSSEKARWGARIISLAQAEADAAPPSGEAAHWRFTAVPWSLPRGLRLCLADVAGGSGTPDMVRRVLAWRDRWEEGEDGAEPTAGSDEAEAGGPPEWRALARANARVLSACEAVERVAREGPSAYDDALKRAAALVSTEWLSESARVACPALGALGELARAFAVFRGALRTVGEVSGVQIEPPAQRARLDALLALAGVAAAGVPGAGGEDALYALVVEAPGADSNSGARAAAEELWASLDCVAPLLMREGAARGAAGAGLRVGAEHVGEWGR